MEFEEILNSFGYTLYHKCNCGGAAKRQYRNKNKIGFDVIVFPKKKTFQIMKKGTKGSLIQLTTALQNL